MSRKQLAEVALVRPVVPVETAHAEFKIRNSRY